MKEWAFIRWSGSLWHFVPNVKCSTISVHITACGKMKNKEKCQEQSEESDDRGQFCVNCNQSKAYKKYLVESKKSESVES